MCPLSVGPYKPVEGTGRETQRTGDLPQSWSSEAQEVHLMAKFPMQGFSDLLEKKPIWWLRARPLEPEVEAHFCHFPVVGPWANDFTSLGFGLLICTMEVQGYLPRKVMVRCSWSTLRGYQSDSSRPGARV